MWKFLPEPHNSIAVWSLVGNAWGPMSYPEIVEKHKTSSTFAVVDEGKFLALANLRPISGVTSAWLEVWLAKEIRRKAQTEEIWQSLYKLIFRDIGFITLVAVTRSRSVARLAVRFGANRHMQIKNMFGPGQDSYLVIWEMG